MLKFTTVEQIMQDSEFLYVLGELRDIDEVVEFCKENTINVDVDLLMKVREFFSQGFCCEKDNNLLSLASLDNIAGGIDNPEKTKQWVSAWDSVVLNASFFLHPKVAEKMQKNNQKASKLGLGSHNISKIAGGHPLGIR